MKSVNPSPDIKDFGVRLKRARIAAGISQRELAMRAELDGGDICRYENGIKAPNLITFVKIIQSLRVSPAELLDERLWKDDIKPERPKW